MKSLTCYQRPSTGKARSQLGSSIQGRLLLQKRKLLPGRPRGKGPTSSMKHRASQEVLSVKVPTSINSNTWNTSSYSLTDKREFISLASIPYFWHFSFIELAFLFVKFCLCNTFVSKGE